MSKAKSGWRANAIGPRDQNVGGDGRTAEEAQQAAAAAYERHYGEKPFRVTKAYAWTRAAWNR